MSPPRPWMATPDMPSSGFVKKNILNEKRCILIVTHDNRIYEFATRILKMEDGRLIGTEQGGAA